MSFTELEHKRYENLVRLFIEKRRPAPEVRDKVDLRLHIDNQNVEIFAIRPVWNDPSRKLESLAANAVGSRPSSVGKSSGCAPTSNGTATSHAST